MKAILSAMNKLQNNVSSSSNISCDCNFYARNSGYVRRFIQYVDVKKANKSGCNGWNRKITEETLKQLKTVIKKTMQYV